MCVNDMFAKDICMCIWASMKHIYIYMYEQVGIYLYLYANTYIHYISIIYIYK